MFMICWFSSGFLLGLIICIVSIIQTKENITLNELMGMFLSIIFASLFGFITCIIILMTFFFEFWENCEIGNKIIIRKNK
jgi:hypothetical protein